MLRILRLMIRIFFTAVCIALFASRAFSAEVVVNPETGLKSWKVEDRGFGLELGKRGQGDIFGGRKTIRPRPF